MHITPREQERLNLFTAAELARRRRARGAPLGAAEATALVCDEVLELAWDGYSLDEVVARAKRVLDPNELLPEVPALVPRVQVEALFPHGSTLVHVEAPFGPAPREGAGSVQPGAGDIELAPGHARAQVLMHNTGPRPIWLSSHFPLDQVNAALTIEPAPAAGYRLDLPAGTAMRFAPDEQRTVTIVAMGGQS
ncbi:urease subunit gamma/beta [Tamaricihabitans halophyticus]|uniref:urease n=1 Tax=Tamaricihabitans halophyticus TaxID=1262583 RepID=A0A4R2QJM0_9PSEU|nr:urease subunit gamma [Tamaricihabitans halophyticus]TCP47221.1 urease subunit gamma/beta [Tamaricihabitans halophyticus]